MAKRRRLRQLQHHRREIKTDHVKNIAPMTHSRSAVDISKASALQHDGRCFRREGLVAIPNGARHGQLRSDTGARTLRSIEWESRT